tara:strand:+ start:333 stop:638 length:306 start_codon:yes stop_codon:yes gene_type:complete
MDAARTASPKSYARQSDRWAAVSALVHLKTGHTYKPRVCYSKHQAMIAREMREKAAQASAGHAHSRLDLLADEMGSLTHYIGSLHAEIVALREDLRAHKRG